MALTAIASVAVSRHIDEGGHLLEMMRERAAAEAQVQERRAAGAVALDLVRDAPPLADRVERRLGGEADVEQRGPSRPGFRAVRSRERITNLFRLEAERHPGVAIELDGAAQ